MGRDTKLTKELQSKIIEFIRAGTYNETACLACGLGESTFYAWLDRGEKETRGIYRDFLEAVKKAKGEAEARNLMIIQKAGDTNWQAAAWYLERVYPDKYGRRDRVQADLKHDGQIKIVLEEVDGRSEGQDH